MSDDKTISDDKNSQIGRRDVLVGAGLLAGVAALSAGPALAAKPKANTEQWDYETDVVCVGSGAAACAAAVTAVDQGARVMLLEKLPLLGGTTAKSGGVTWIPNHAFLRAKGVDDRREDCLCYMARYSYPQIYTPNHPTLGLTETDYRLLEAFYDNGWRMLDRMQALGAVQFQEFNLWQVQQPAPDYADHFAENKVPAGRCVEPATGAGYGAGGGSLTVQLEAWLRAHNVPILVEHRVTRVIKQGDRVIGVEAQYQDKLIRIKTHRGVIFGSGGYAHNTELVGRHQKSLYGACAMPGSTGDFIAIAAEAGASMGALNTAWRSQVVLEEALENRAVGYGVFVLPGDSMLLVNKYGQRVVNEKRNYNDRTQIQFVFDPVREEYPNQLLFMIFDERTLDAFGGDFPLPLDRRESRFLIQGATLDELAKNIAARLQQLENQTGRFALASEFAQALNSTVERFNGYARKGEDLEFARGLHEYDRQWHKLFSAMRAGTKYPVNPLPNLTMHPLAKQGPFYAFILGAGALDTNGGPAINAQAQVLDSFGKPIPGLYGAGNCIASPSRDAYYGAGGTIGLAMTFGYIAAMHVVKNSQTAAAEKIARRTVDEK